LIVDTTTTTIAFEGEATTEAAAIEAAATETAATEIAVLKN
jgi:hypothetical protein